MRSLCGIALVFFLAAPAAAATACPDKYAGGQMPAVVNTALLNGAFELCYEDFAVFYSGLTRTPLYVAEHIVRADLVDASAIDREDAFHEETALPAGIRAELSDYAGSGFDRGHMAPAADMSSDTAMAQSFALTNIVPQTAEANRGVWREIETRARDLAYRTGEIYVVTGPVYSSSEIRSIGAGVLVPDYTFKAILVPGQGAAAYLAENDADPECWEISIEALDTAIGMSLFPALAAPLRTTPINLPNPG